MRVCVVSGCGRLSYRARCNSHLRAESKRRAAKAKANGLHTPGWQRMRKARLSLANNICELNDEGCTIRATSVHIPPELKGDHTRARLEDVRAACHHCHGVVDAPRAKGGIHA